MTELPAVANYTNVPEPIFLGFVGKLKKLEAEKDSIVGKIRALKKQAKADGVDLKAADTALKIAALLDDEARSQHNTALAYMKFMRLPIGSQMSFLDGIEDDISEMSEKQRRSKWFDDGWACSARGGDRIDCPHDPTGDAGQAWMDGYQENQVKILAGIQALEVGEETPAEPQPEAPPPIAAVATEADEGPKKRGRKSASIHELIKERKPPTPPEPPMAA